MGCKMQNFFNSMGIKWRKSLKSFRKNSSGTFALTWALAMTGTIVAVGAGYDYAQLSAAKKKSQAIADTIALSAAVYVKANDGPPTDGNDGFLNGVQYATSESGHTFNGMVLKGPEAPKFTVNYDDIKKEARVEVQGKTRPAFMHVIGYMDLPFKASATVKYEDKQVKRPASIVMIMDNSGSMFFSDKPFDDTGVSPAGARSRISGLKEAASTFYDTLETIAGGVDENGSRFLRMGMLAYSSNTISNRTVPLNWDTLSASSQVRQQTSNMTPGGGTYSAPPMETAVDWMTGENAKHLAENSHNNPLKIAIFMTDGQNTLGNCCVIPGNTDVFHRFDGNVPRTIILPPIGTHPYPIANYLVGRQSGAQDEFWAWIRQGNGPVYCVRTQADIDAGITRSCTVANLPHFDYQNTVGGTNRFYLHNQNLALRFLAEKGEELLENNEQYLESQGYTEGTLELNTDERTIASCRALRAQGVDVYTIGFALQSGLYDTLDHHRIHGNPPTYSFPEEQALAATELMQGCASDPKNFSLANDTEALENVFQNIGFSILRDLIRITS